MAETMTNQPSHWWWLDSHGAGATRRSPWLQSTLDELNEKTRAMLKLIEADADSFAQRAEMYYKKRPELVSLVEDFYRTHRLLAERYDQVRPDSGIRLLKAEGFPLAASAKFQSEKLMSFADNGYDSYSENGDVEDCVESEVDDPEEEEETKLEKCKEEEVPFLSGNDEMVRLREEIERLIEENRAHKDQIKLKDTVCDEVMMLREEIERLREENKAQKDQIKQKDTFFDEVMMLREEIERLREENEAQKDQLKQKDTICGEVMLLRGEIERLREENRAQKDQLNQKDTVCGEVMTSREEIKRLREDNRAQKDQLKQIMMLREEIETLREENSAQKDQLRQKDTTCDEAMILREEIEILRQDNRAQKDQLSQKDTICDEIMMLKEEMGKLREENRVQKDQLKQKDGEKMDVIRNLSLAIDVLKQDNIKMRSFIAKESTKKWKNPFEFTKLKEALSGKLFNGTPMNQPRLVAL